MTVEKAQLWAPIGSTPSGPDIAGCLGLGYKSHHASRNNLVPGCLGCMQESTLVPGHFSCSLCLPPIMFTFFSVCASISLARFLKQLKPSSTYVIHVGYRACNSGRVVDIMLTFLSGSGSRGLSDIGLTDLTSSNSSEACSAAVW